MFDIQNQPSRPCHAAPRTVRFCDAEEAWFWTMAIVLARHDGAEADWRPCGPERPCDPEDLLQAVDGLYRAGGLTLAHARVLRACGERQRRPALVPERDYRLWCQAIAAIGWQLRRLDVLG